MHQGYGDKNRPEQGMQLITQAAWLPGEMTLAGREGTNRICILYWFRFPALSSIGNVIFAKHSTGTMSPSTNWQVMSAWIRIEDQRASGRVHFFSLYYSECFTTIIFFFFKKKPLNKRASNYLLRRTGMQGLPDDWVRGVSWKLHIDYKYYAACMIQRYASASWLPENSFTLVIQWKARMKQWARCFTTQK